MLSLRPVCGCIRRRLAATVGHEIRGGAGPDEPRSVPGRPQCEGGDETCGSCDTKSTLHRTAQALCRTTSKGAAGRSMPGDASNARREVPPRIREAERNRRDDRRPLSSSENRELSEAISRLECGFLSPLLGWSGSVKLLSERLLAIVPNGMSVSASFIREVLSQSIEMDTRPDVHFDGPKMDETSEAPRP